MPCTFASERERIARQKAMAELDELIASGGLNIVKDWTTGSLKLDGYTPPVESGWKTDVCILSTMKAHGSLQTQQAIIGAERRERVKLPAHH